MKSGIGMKQVEPDHYCSPGYDSKGRFCSYWHQINEIFSLRPEKVLEIGIGNGFVSKYLRERGVNVTTLDIDERLNPDLVGTVLKIPLPDESFDVVSCCELLEHLPYKNLGKALSEIFRCSKSYAVLSVPDVGRVYRLCLQIPKIGTIQRLIPLPRIKRPVHNFTGQHYWEIGKAGYPLRRVMDGIRGTGFEIRKTYRVFERPYHRFFICAKEKYSHGHLGCKTYGGD